MNQNTPKVSVVIPSYNQAQYLKAAIDSVLAQIYKNYEIIVVDDGSTDQTHEVVAEYGTSVQHVFQPKQGRSAARNRGVSLAKGEYIAFLDADDVWKPHKLEQQMKWLEHNPDIHLLHCFTDVIDEQGVLNDRNTQIHRMHHLRAHQSGYRYAALALDCIVFTSCVVIKKKTYQNTGGFDIALNYLEDWDLYLRIALTGPIAALDQVLVSYRIYPEQYKGDDFTQARIQVAQKHLSLLQKNKNVKDLNQASRNLSLQIAETNFILGRYVEAKKYYFFAIEQDKKMLFKKLGSFKRINLHVMLCLLPAWFINGFRNTKQIFRAESADSRHHDARI